MIHKNIFRITYGILIILVVLALVKSWKLGSVGGMAPATDLILVNDKWALAQPSGGEEEPGCRYVYTIPEDNTERLVLSIENYWSTMRISLDGEELYYYEDDHREKGVGRHWIELPADAAGRVLSISSDRCDLMLKQTVTGNSYLGTRDAVLFRFINDNLYALIFGVFSILMSAALCAGSIYLKHQFSNSSYKAILYLGLFILFTGGWVVSDSQILQFVTGRTAAVAVSSFLCFMIMPVFLLKFIREILLYRKKPMDILCGLYLANMAVSSAFYLFRVLPLYRMILIEHGLIVISIGAVLWNGIAEVRKYGNREMIKIVTGFGVLSVFGAAALLLFYVNPSAGYPYLYSMGIVLFFLFLADAAVKRVYYFLGKSARIEAYRRLAYVDMMTGMENRTAFMEDQEKQNVSPKLAYIMLDINNLKAVNDRFGHQEGDRLIVAATECIRDIFEQMGKCYRIGGDEFVVVLEGVSKEDVKLALSRLEQKIERSNRGRKHPVEIAYGYSMPEDKAATKKDLFDCADANMYVKKQEMKESREQAPGK